jgi:transcriptional regulator with XRE-family HTH domain
VPNYCERRERLQLTALELAKICSAPSVGYIEQLERGKPRPGWEELVDRKLAELELRVDRLLASEVKRTDNWIKSGGFVLGDGPTFTSIASLLRPDFLDGT